MFPRMSGKAPVLPTVNFTQKAQNRHDISSGKRTAQALLIFIKYG
jgi:hypothetical protein